jgi:hypothetical protein
MPKCAVPFDRIDAAPVNSITIGQDRRDGSLKATTGQRASATAVCAPKQPDSAARRQRPGAIDGINHEFVSPHDAAFGALCPDQSGI